MTTLNDEVEYGARGTLGLMVPQANTTAEPEVQAMLGADIALLTTRMTSPQAELQDRLDDYLTHIETYIDTFSNAPLSGLGFLITGSTYHLNPDQEDRLFEKLGSKRGCLIVSAGQSIRRAFSSLGAQRIGLVSPYPEWLTAKSVAYWTRAGVDIIGVETPQKVGGFHNIYTIRNDSVIEAARRLLPLKPDLILLAGAGMPTLGSIMALTDIGMPAISSNFCMAWQLNQMAIDRLSDDASIVQLMHKDASWRHNFYERFPRARIVTK